VVVENYPLDILAYQLDLESTAGESPLFDVVVLLENIHDKSYIDHLHCNMVFSFINDHGSIRGRLEYNPARYQEDTVTRISAHFILLLTAAL